MRLSECTLVFWDVIGGSIASEPSTVIKVVMNFVNFTKEIFTHWLRNLHDPNITSQYDTDVLLVKIGKFHKFSVKL